MRRVLAVKLSSFGDVVHVTPCLRALRRTFSGAEILVAVDRTWAGALRPDPHVDGVVEADPRRRDPLTSWFDARRSLAPRGGFDLAVDFQGLGRSAAWVYASGARRRVGRGRVRPGWQAVVQPDPGQHAVRVCAEVAALAGADAADLAPRLFCADQADRSLSALLRQVGAAESGFVVANPYAAWVAKTWPCERWAALIRRLREEAGRAVVLCGGPRDIGAAERLLGELGAAAPPSLVGRVTIEEAVCLYRRAAVVVGGDSGPLHAAAAVGTPVVGLYGPTWPERTGPWGDGHRVLQVSRGDGPHAYRDPASRRHMERIAVEAVFDAVMAVLAT